MSNHKFPSLPMPKFLQYAFVQRGLRYGLYFGIGMIALGLILPYFPDQIRFFDFTEGKRWLLLLIFGFIAASLQALADLGIPMVCDGWCLPATLGAAVVTVATLAAECILVGFLAVFVRWGFFKIWKLKYK
ncbi:MAG: hypothetical protein ABTQ34_04875 [Bdellovibrionales bacterium]